MCVIVRKPAGIKLDLETVNKMDKANPHGIGLMYFTRCNRIQILKGLDVKLLMSELDRLESAEVVLHFRYATHGARGATMCHPFPLINDYKRLKCGNVLLSQSIGALVHNGIISGFGNRKGLSDTADFIACALSKFRDTKDQLSLLKATDCKYILAKHGKFHQVGVFHDYHGLMVSNLTWNYSTTYTISKGGVTTHYYGNAHRTEVSNGATVSGVTTIPPTKQLERKELDEAKEKFQQGKSVLLNGWDFAGEC
jgi:predicted glutamine amidotransferase